MPIDELPAEVLLSIIDLASLSPIAISTSDNKTDSEDRPSRDYDAVIKYSRVCRLWRRTILDCGTLWSEIVMRKEPSEHDLLLHACLQRSGTAPLVSEVIYGQRASQLLVPQIMEEMHRTTILRITVDDPALFQSSEHILQKPSPLLMHFCVKSSADISMDDIVLFNDEAPALRRLSLSRVGIPRRLPNTFAMLTSLKLSQIDGTDFQRTLARLLDMLGECVALRDLLLSIKTVSREGENNTSYDTRLVRLPKLRYLHLKVARWACVALFRSICAPDLSILVLSGSADPPCTVDYLTDSNANPTRIPTGPVQYLELVLDTYLSFYLHFHESPPSPASASAPTPTPTSQTTRPFLLRYNPLAPLTLPTLTIPAFRIWDLTSLTSLTLTLPPTFSMEALPVFNQMFEECTQLGKLRFYVRGGGHGLSGRRGQFEVIHIPTSYILVLLSIGRSNKTDESSVTRAAPTQWREGGRKFPFPQLTDLEFAGEPLIRDKDDMDTLVTFLRVRANFGYRLHRLHIRGSCFSEEDMQLLISHVDVTNTDVLNVE